MVILAFRLIRPTVRGSQEDRRQDPLELEHLEIATHRRVLKPRTICKCFGGTGGARRTSVVDQSLPATPGDTEALIRRIGNIRETHYGGFWDFTADLKHGDMAYTNEPLPAHTDNTYFVSPLMVPKTDPSGLQIFHLLSHPPPGKGGSSLLVDAFYAASILETLHPEAYATLSRLAIPSHASGSEGTLLRPLAQPVFKHDTVTGEIAQVRWNNEDRGVLGKGWRADEVEAWYDAAGKWEEAVKSADAEYWVQLTPGTMVVIDNWRVMHGRSTFTGQRRMCGAYVGRDDWRSRLETLKRTFADKPKEEEARKEHEIWNVGW
ncbi:hypothetical protein QFC24_002289 [Naganishia onofrii]|uniref:Uncharacterized protein n=1 Tax=Naganishia onofrii TaxID=1851511 RepID=A0ACC2XTK1_9TREE|nr:hypothetical protein QFC24_002289 [Naganishia onofrii]